MIDIHPPHHGAMTRRDILTHLAIVVAGILIAIGLEQAVEYVHHRNQLAEARRELSTEYKINLAVYSTQRVEFDRFIPILQRNLQIFIYLRAHPAAPHAEWPGEFSWYHSIPRFVDATWKSLQGTGMLALMPQSELQRYTTLYDFLTRNNEDAANTVGLFRRAMSYGLRNQDPASMTPAQLDDAIQSASDALGLYAHMVNLQMNLNLQFKDFVPAPSRAYYYEIQGLPDQIDQGDGRAVSQAVRRSPQNPSRDTAEGVAIEQQLHDEIARIQADADKTK